MSPRPMVFAVRRVVPVTLSLLLEAGALATGAANPGLIADESPTAPHVTTVSLSSVYISAGEAEGLSAGDRLEVVRDGVVVALLEVRLTTPHKADCRQVEGTGEIRAGDAVRPGVAPAPPAASQPAPPPDPPPGTVTAEAGTTAAGDPPAEAPAPDPASATAPTPVAAPVPTPAAASPTHSSLRAFGLRGRVGVRFMGVWDSNDGPDYQQPAIDFRIDGTRVGGSNFDMYADVRARRSYRTFADGDTQTENRTRVYRLAGAWQQAGSPFRITFGRLFSPSLAVISLVDGFLGEYRKDRFAAGAFAGTEPDAEDYGYSRAVRDYGGFAEYGSAVAAKRRWAVTGGAVVSHEEGTINREFLFLQGRYDDHRLSGFLTQEIDINRGWREEQEGDRWTATSSYASLRWRATDTFGLNAGYDSRRNVLLYRDYVSPETDFDDQYRRGLWFGADGGAGDHFTYGVSFRRSDVGDDDTADAATILLGVRGLTSAGLSLSTRGTHYTNEQLEGWLVSLAASFSLTAKSRLEAYGGVRRETVLGSWVPEGNHDWFGLSWDLFAGRHWMFTTTVEHNQGQAEDNDQVYATMSYRF